MFSNKCFRNWFNRIIRIRIITKEGRKRYMANVYSYSKEINHIGVSVPDLDKAVVLVPKAHQPTDDDARRLLINTTHRGV
jgi:hypothetical protein